MKAQKKSESAMNDNAPEELARLQTSFAGHIRNPGSVPAPEGIEDRRMAIYRELFFNNIVTFLSSNFPVLKTLYSNQDWLALCRDFFSSYRCHTPLFPEIPREFLKYLQNQRCKYESDPPFMLELAHYEWVELALELDETDIEAIAVNTNGDVLNGIPILSPLAWPLSYKYPVHNIRQDFQPDTVPGKPTHLLVWRQQDFSIKFMQLNEISLLLLQKLKEETSQSGLELLTEIARTINHSKPEVVVEGGRALMNELLEKQIILGTRP